LFASQIASTIAAMRPEGRKARAIDLAGMPSAVRRMVAILAGGLAWACAAPAEPVIFKAPATVADDADAMTAGRLLYAFDESAVTVTLNGVTFSAGSSSVSLGAGDIALSGFSGVNNSVFNGGASNPWNGLSADYKNLLRGATFSAITNAPATVTLNGLTAGHYYAVQFWVNDSRGTTPPADRQETISSAGGNARTLDYNSLDGLGGVGQHTIGLFAAGATGQSFRLAGLTGSPSAQMNAIQVRDVSNLGCWIGTAGPAWDAAATANFADNLFDAPLAPTNFAAAKSALDAAVFADAFWDSGSLIAVTQTAVTVTGGGVAAGDVLFQNSSVDYTVTSSGTNGIGGATSVSVLGGGTLELRGSHAYSGATTLGAGTLRIADKSQVPATSGIDIGAAATLTVSAVTGNWNADWNRTMRGAGVWNLNGSNNTIWTQITGDLSAFTGTLRIGPRVGVFGPALTNYPGAGATIEVAAGGELNVYQTMVSPTGTVHLQGGSGASWDTTAVALRTTSTGTVRYNVIVHADTPIGCWPGQGGGTYAGNFDLGSSALTVKVGGATDQLTMAGVLSGNGRLIKTGPGTLTLSGANTYHGGTTINGGTLKLAAGVPLGVLPSGLRVMPLGDSITYGGGSNAGYRGPLCNLLQPAATGFQFVGASTQNAGSLPLVPVDQTHHNGYASYATLDLANNLDGYDPTRFNQFGGTSRDPWGGYWLDGGNGTGRAAVLPDVALLMVGANDIYQHNQGNPQINLPNFQTNLTTLIGKLVTQRPDARVFVAKITPWPAQGANVTTVNNGVNAAAAAFQAQGKKVSVVDLYTEFPANGLSADGLHPNDTGYQFMADRWYSAMLAAYGGAAVSSALPSGSPVAIATGAVLNLNGNQAVIGDLTGGGSILGGPVTVEGSLAPGDKGSAGTLSIGNSLVFAPAASLAFELGTNGDLVAVAGDLTLDGALDISDAGGLTTNAYLLFTYGGALTDNGLATASMPHPALAGSVDTNTAGQVRLNVGLSPFGAWLTEHFGGYTNAEAAASADPDGDGLNNEEEFLSGTDPTDNASALQTVRVAGDSNGFYVIAWDSVGGKTYRVQYSDGDGSGGFAGAFTDIPADLADTNSAGVAGALHFTDDFTLTAPPTAGARYYRVRLAP
jgi:fibronectin-binding autotransporter adhesin